MACGSNSLQHWFHTLYTYSNKFKTAKNPKFWERWKEVKTCLFYFYGLRQSNQPPSLRILGDTYSSELLVIRYEEKWIGKKKCPKFCFLLNFWKNLSSTSPVFYYNFSCGMVFTWDALGLNGHVYNKHSGWSNIILTQVLHCLQLPRTGLSL